MAERQFGPYKLIRQIAVGGMAEIHLAKTAGIAGFEKYVALKMIHPNFAEDEQFIQMLVDEAKIAVQLTHGNIAQTFDLGRVGETYYITMEYVDGADLYKLLRRASEQDAEMPLDVCAFIGKEVASALDHAHRKRDHAGKPLGIVHRDVSPQNVLVSYSGEVKLVDFGIAKATMKARQTAVGVIKGKYYYMSPEQAWGDPIDHRSDIFSAGIVLYEMITGQMLYLEEDLHKLLEMARSAEIRPPSVLRKGVPPQLERIVMHALTKVPGERYQSAGDFATDLERFLHAYSPVFTASKLSNLMRQVIGDPIQVPDDPGFASIEFRDGAMSTHPLDDSEVAHAIDAEELRDENSMIFSVSELENGRPDEGQAVKQALPSKPLSRASAGSGARTPPPVPATPPPVPGAPPPSPGAVRQSAPRVTRATDPMPMPSVVQQARPSSAARVPPGAQPRPSAKLPQVTKPRQIGEDTRQLAGPAPANPLHDDGWDDPERGGVSEDDLENIAERTLITAAPGMSSFMVDVGGDGDGPIEATLVTTAPPGFGGGEDSTAEPAPASDDDDDDGPTLSRDFSLAQPTKPVRPTKARPKAPPPAALAAKIHAPAVSELRKPRPSRKTPPGGSPVVGGNVLQAIVGAAASAPMPTPRPSSPPPPSPAVMQSTMAMPSSGMMQAQPPPQPQAQAQLQPMMSPAVPPGPHMPTDPYVAQFPIGTPGAQPSYNHDASGLPMAIPTPPGVSVAPPPAMSYAQPPGGYPGYPAQPVAPQMSPPHGYPQVTPGALYQLQPSPQPASLTGQMRLWEVDEIPSQYKLGAARQRWFTYIVSGILAVSVAAGVTFLIIRSMREATPTTGSVRLQSVPAGAEVLFDGTRLTDRTPLTIDGAPVGTRHTIRIELTGYEAVEEIVDIPRTGKETSVVETLRPATGKIIINSTPGNAEIWINGTLRGRTPTTLPGIDMSSTRQIELRLDHFEPFRKDLVWKDSRAVIDATLQPARR